MRPNGEISRGQAGWGSSVLTARLGPWSIAPGRSWISRQLMSESPRAALAKDDSVLVTEAKAGSYAAFEELVNRYEKKSIVWV